MPDIALFELPDLVTKRVFRLMTLYEQYHYSQIDNQCQKYIRKLHENLKDVLHNIEAITMEECPMSCEVILVPFCKKNPEKLNYQRGIAFKFGDAFGLSEAPYAINSINYKTRVLRELLPRLADIFGGEFGTVRMEQTSLSCFEEYWIHPNMKKTIRRCTQTDVYSYQARKYRQADRFLTDFEVEKYEIESGRVIQPANEIKCEQGVFNTLFFHGRYLNRFCHTNLKSLEIGGRIKTHHMGKFILEWFLGNLPNLSRLIVELGVEQKPHRNNVDAPNDDINHDRIHERFQMIRWDWDPRSNRSSRFEITDELTLEEKYIDCSRGFNIHKPNGEMATLMKQGEKHYFLVWKEENMKRDVAVSNVEEIDEKLLDNFDEHVESDYESSIYSEDEIMSSDESQNESEDEDDESSEPEEWSDEENEAEGVHGPIIRQYSSGYQEML